MRNLALYTGVFACVLLGVPASADIPPAVSPGLTQPPPVDRNVKLRIQLDRKSMHVFEPVYVCLTADQFAAGDPEIHVSKDKGVFVRVEIDSKAWVRSDFSGGGGLSTHRLGLVLQTNHVNGQRTYLFAAEGRYQIKVQIGTDEANLDLTVAAAPDPAESKAWELLTDKDLDDIISDNFQDITTQQTINACAKVIRQYPRTLCSAYCQSYVRIAAFKQIFEQNKRVGGKAVYGTVAGDLNKIAEVFRESFFGEMIAFYAAYADGLARDFDTLLAVVNGSQTRVTPWASALEEMQTEVMVHVGPKIVAMDPKDWAAASSQPAVVPATQPVTPPSK